MAAMAVYQVVTETTVGTKAVLVGWPAGVATAAGKVGVMEAAVKEVVAKVAVTVGAVTVVGVGA